MKVHFIGHILLKQVHECMDLLLNDTGNIILYYEIWFWISTLFTLYRWFLNLINFTTSSIGLKNSTSCQTYMPKTCYNWFRWQFFQFISWYYERQNVWYPPPQTVIYITMRLYIEPCVGLSCPRDVSHNKEHSRNR